MSDVAHAEIPAEANKTEDADAEKAEATTEVEDQAEAEPESGEPDPETDADPEDEEPETLDFVFGNETFSVPREQLPEELAERLDKFTRNTWADYTRKSQEVAEQRKSVEATREVVEKLNSLNGEALQTFARGLNLQQEIAALEQKDINALWQSNPDEARALSDRLSQKRSELQSTIAKVSQQESELSAAQHQETQRRMDEGRKTVAKAVKDFDEDAVKEYVVERFGLSRDQAETWPLNPATAIMAHESMMFRKMQNRTKPKPQQKQAAPVTPVSKGSGAKNVNPQPSDKDDMKTWLRKRNAQLKRRRAV